MYHSTCCTARSFARNRAVVASAAVPAAAQQAPAAATAATGADVPAVRSPSGFVENVLEASHYYYHYCYQH
jgi:hypothetical protein